VRLSIKTKQVLGVTGTVGAVVVAVSLYNLSEFARLSLHESHARAELLARAIYQRAYAIVPRAADPRAVLREDGGLRSILEASNYSKEVTDAAVVDPDGVVVAHWDPTRVGRTLAPRPSMDPLLQLNSLQQLWAVLTDPGREVEVRQPLTLGERDFGAIRIGISTLLVRGQLEEVLGRSVSTALVALLVATLVAMLLAQLFLRPIHVLKSGLTRLQRGESGITLDLPKDEFGDLGIFFSAVSTKLSADRSELAGRKASLESIVERLEDAVALFDAHGDMLFANPTMRALLPADGGTSGPQAWRELVQATIATRQSHGPVSMTAPSGQGDSHTVEWLLMSHAIESGDGRLVGIMLMGRNAGYLAEVQSTLRYSRKLTALGRLSAGVAHEVKNPLNAMMIHLELLRQKLSGGPAPRAVRSSGGSGPIGLRLDEDRLVMAAPAIDAPAALEHVSVIAGEIRRLDQVLQGFLKFTRPEDLRLQPVDVGSLVGEVGRVLDPEARKNGVRIEIDCPPGLPEINGDPAMLRQALLNLGINACQAMPHGGALRFRSRSARARRVELVVEDTGVGIKPEHLTKIFDLYFTTRQKGSGIGLSMVYRTVQLHDGEIEVQSTPGVGTRFRILLPQV
jgi:signal transduction histidine kinase